MSLDKHLKAIYILPIIVIVLLTQSCKTSEKFVMSAPAGTQISTPIPGATAISEDSQKIKMTVPSDGYCGYVLAKPANSNLQIPIGVDYRKNKHQGNIWASLGPIIGGGLACGLCASEALLIPGIVIGTLALPTGMGMLGPVCSRAEQVSYYYNFGYVKNQQIKIPDLSPTLLHPNKPKNFALSSIESKSVRSKASSGKDIVTASNTFTKVNSNRFNYANKIIGTYIGSGVLLKGKDIEEKYPEITVLLESKKKNQVLVRIIESDQDFFDTELLYDIQKDKRGNYKLTIQGMPGATISISKEGVLTFTHNKVNIDNSIYTLSIKARIGE